VSDPVDERLQARLRALGEAIPDPTLAPRLTKVRPDHVAQRAIKGAGLMATLATFAIVMVVAIAYLTHAVATGAPTGESASAPTGAIPSLPPGGLAPDLAVQRARQSVASDAKLVSSVAGQFGAVYQDTRNDGAGSIDPGRLVWAVKFQSEFTICPPDGSACYSPRPGWTTVILDYTSGDFIGSFGYSPP
jgi:hypothetical protein